jgi:hypothetical protein
MRGRIAFLAAAVLLLALCATSSAADPKKCVGAHLVLWGDGAHDDTEALNAWFRGETVVWGDTQQPVGAEIADRVFLLSSTVYIPAGFGRRLERFRMVWPHRHETVAGGMITTGDNPDEPPVAVAVTTVNAGPDEGVPFEAETPLLERPDAASACLVS